MPATFKSQIALLLWMLALHLDARAADIPSGKLLATPQRKSEVLTRREPRLPLRQEIFQAIQNDLAQKGISGRRELQPGDLRIQSSLPEIEPELQKDIGLQVKRMGFDPIRRELVFELWASREPQYLPFEVTTQRDPRSLGLTSQPGWKWAEADVKSGTESPATGRTPTRSPAPVLAKPGKPATLIMIGQNVRITLNVIPLQPGSRGQRILVRDPATARVITGEVVDEGLLQCTF
jgi:hypothetical protein